MKHKTNRALGLLGATLLAALTTACAPPATTMLTSSGAECDPVAAKALARKDYCLRAHSGFELAR